MINIDELIKQALKAQNKTELRAYRNLKAEFQLASTAKGAKPLDEARQIQILNKYLKTLEKSISDFSQAHRDDLVAEYKNESEVLKKLLPEPVNELQIYSELHEWCLEHHYTQHPITAVDYSVMILIPKSDMGKAIKYLKSKFPQANGKIIAEIVKEFVV